MTHIFSPSNTNDLGPCSVSKVRKPRLTGSVLKLADDGAGVPVPQAANRVVVNRRLANASRAIFLRLIISWIIPDKGGNWIPLVNLALHQKYHILLNHPSTSSGRTDFYTYPPRRMVSLSNHEP